MSDKTSARWLQDGPTAAQGQVDNIFKKGKKKNCSVMAVRERSETK